MVRTAPDAWLWRWALNKRHLILTTTPWADTVTIPILQMWKLRLREVRSLVWGCTDNKGVGEEAPCLPAVPTLLMAMQVDNLLQADGHGVVPVDTGRGGRVRLARCLSHASWGSPTHRLLHPPHQDHLTPNIHVPRLPRLYLPFFWLQYPSFPTFPLHTHFFNLSPCGWGWPCLPSPFRTPGMGTWPWLSWWSYDTVPDLDPSRTSETQLLDLRENSLGKKGFFVLEA